MVEYRKRCIYLTLLHIEHCRSFSKDFLPRIAVLPFMLHVTVHVHSRKITLSPQDITLRVCLCVLARWGSTSVQNIGRFYYTATLLPYIAHTGQC